MRRLAAAFAVGLVATLAAGSRPAAAAAPTAMGWWWEAEQGAPVPPPPTVPAGGFMVGGDPSGPNAVAALRFQLADDDSAPILTLGIADNGNVNGASDTIVACLSASPWKPAAPGNWSDKPAPRCDKFAKGTLSGDGKTVAFALSPLVAAGGTTLDVVLTPAAGANFELTFNAPSEASLATTKVPSDSSSDFASATDTSPAFDSGTADSPSPDLSSDASSLLTSPYSATQPPPVDPSQTVAFNPTAAASQARGAGSPPPSTRRTPAIAVLLLLAVAGVAWASGRAQVPALRRLGPLSTSDRPATPARVEADAAVGGLGRFARVRLGAPPKL